MTEKAPNPVPSVEEVQEGWHELTLRVGQLEVERSALEKENKSLRYMLERVIEHREKSHGELVLLLTGLVSKLPINDVGVMVSKLVEHNHSVSEVCAALTGGKASAGLPQPSILKALDQTKRELTATLKPTVDEFIKMDVPLETSMLQNLVTQPKSFFLPAVARGNRCYVKGQLPRERIVREFGEEAMVFFNDLTTDAKLNPRPKPEEIVLTFKNDFEALLQQNPGLIPDKRKELQSLHQSVQRSKAPTEEARAQRRLFQKLSFVLELLNFYESQGTEPPDVVFAQRLPALIEQLVVTGPQDVLEEKSIAQAETLLAYIVNPDHWLTVVNNLGKGGGVTRTLKYILRLRTGKADQHDVAAEFVKHLTPPPPQAPPQPRDVAPILRLLKPEMQGLVARAFMISDRMRREDAEALGRAIGKELGLAGMEEAAKAAAVVPVETERLLAWEKVKELIKKRGDPSAIAAAIRDRLHSKYDADEVKQSWLTLMEADAMSLIRTICQLPYLPDGRTDEIARAVLQTYTSRLTHEKYAATLTKVVNSLKGMYKAKPDSPTLLNFISLVRWVDPEAANRLEAEVGMPAPAQ